jgi:putative redox protein
LSREIVVGGPASALVNAVQIGPHAFTADEPPPAGSDAGPSPFEIVCAALGACTSMTLSLYARARGIPLEHVTVHLVHSRPARHRIDRTIELGGPLSDAQRATLLEIANKCPVHRAYTEGIDVVTVLSAP